MILINSKFNVQKYFLLINNNRINGGAKFIQTNHIKIEMCHMDTDAPNFTPLSGWCLHDGTYLVLPLLFCIYLYPTREFKYPRGKQN